MKIAVKEVGKDLQIVETRERYRGACVRSFIDKDATAQFVVLNGDSTLTLGVNEDGLLLDLPLNFLFEASSVRYPIQKIVGTAVFVRHKFVNPWVEEIWDFEVDDLTDADLKHIEKMLDPAYQEDLQRRFNDYGRGAMHFWQW